MDSIYIIFPFKKGGENGQRAPLGAKPQASKRRGHCNALTNG